MALPTTPPLNEVLTQARERWLNLKISAIQARDRSASNDISAGYVLLVLDRLREDLSYFNSIASTPGLTQYARDQYADQGMDIVADFNAMMNAITNTINWIVSALPKAPADGQGNEYLLLKTIDATGVRSDRLFTPAQTAGLRTQLDSIIATIA